MRSAVGGHLLWIGIRLDRLYGLMPGPRLENRVLGQRARTIGRHDLNPGVLESVREPIGRVGIVGDLDQHVAQLTHEQTAAIHVRVGAVDRGVDDWRMDDGAVSWKLRRKQRASSRTRNIDPEMRPDSRHPVATLVDDQHELRAIRAGERADSRCRSCPGTRNPRFPTDDGRSTPGRWRRTREGGRSVSQRTSAAGGSHPVREVCSHKPTRARTRAARPRGPRAGR